MAGRAGRPAAERGVEMVLRGGLGRRLNAGLAVLSVVPLCMLAYFWYLEDPSAIGHVLALTLAGFGLGALGGVPALLMNKRALMELYPSVVGKFFLSSQLALLDSRHGKNAAAYFYVVLLAWRVCAPLFRGPWTAAVSAFAYGLYLSANVLPFVGETEWRSKGVAPASGSAG